MIKFHPSFYNQNREYPIFTKLTLILSFFQLYLLNFGSDLKMYPSIQTIFLIISIIFLNLFSLSSGSVQCNLGLKLYSVESGKAVCAPFGHYGCTESCEWNTTCTKTSHFNAFKGRRTYVTGFILTDNNFLLQCCASLGTIIQMSKS